ncbi:MAG: GAF domain-containing protein [Candidatus Latescibacteria bacterium]|nr:GAF domain-containing protein [Candidatus Latescibacterota bacterium]
MDYQQLLRALHQVRAAVWQMSREEDIHQVLESMSAALQDLGLAFDNLGVNIIDTAGEAPEVRFFIYKPSAAGGWWERDSRTQPDNAAMRCSIGRLVQFWQAGETVYRPDLQRDDPYGEYAQLSSGNPGIRSLIDLPFTHGTLALNSRQPHAFSGHLEILEAVAQVLSEGFSRVNDLRALERQVRAREALNRAVGAVVNSKTLDEIFHEVVTGAAELAFGGQAMLFLCDPGEQLLVPRAAVGLRWEICRDLRLQPGEGLSGQVLATGEPVAGPYLAEPSSWRAPPAVRELFLRAMPEPAAAVGWAGAVPLRHPTGKIIGTLAVGGCLYPLGSEDLAQLANLAQQAALAIERQQATLALRESELRYRGLVENLHAIIREADALTLATTFVSPRAESLLGYPAGQWLAEPDFWARHIHPEDRDQTLATCRAFAARALDHTLQYRFLAHDGQVRWFEEVLHVIPASPTLPARLRGVMIDISYRRQAKAREQLDLALQRLRAVVLKMSGQEDWASLITALDQELRRLVPCTQSSIQFVDARADTFTGHFIGIPPLPPIPAQPLPASLREVVTTGKPLHRRSREEIRQCGDLLPPEVGSVVDVPFLGGTLAMNSLAEHTFTAGDLQILESFAEVLSEAYLRLEDLNRLQAKEEELRQSQKMEAVGQLAAGIAHNFNNLLQGVLLNAELCQSQHPPAQLAEYLQEVLDCATRAAEMVGQLMVIGRHWKAPEHRALDLGQVVGDMVSICRKTFDRRIDLRLHLPAQLLPVMGNANQLGQVLLNLLVNARDALEAGEGRAPLIQVRLHPAARRDPQGRAGSFVCLQVEDNGVGMTPEVRAQIFDPFFTTKEVGKGTGLGLSTAYSILRDHSGWIECESAPGKGTRLSCFIPAAESHPDEEPGEVAAMASGSGTLLVIDDESFIRKALASTLGKAGYTVLEARDGTEGLALFEQHHGHLDLVLLDLSMPGLSGREVLRRLKEQDPRVPVVICSGYGIDPPPAECAALIHKPVRARELCAVVQQLLAD